MEHNYIRIAWDSYGPALEEADLTDGKSILNAFSIGMRVGDLVRSCYSASTIDAVGVVMGDEAAFGKLISVKNPGFILTAFL